MRLASGIPGNRLDNIGRLAHGGIPQMYAVFSCLQPSHSCSIIASLEPL